MAVEIPRRDRRGRKINERARGPESSWKRMEALLRDPHWEENFRRVNLNPNCGTEVGGLFNRGLFQQRHCEAARIYAEVVGRYDRYHRDPKLPRTPGSPSYERSFRGNDDELERRGRDGSLPSYVRQGKRAKKAYEKLAACIPNEVARAVIDDLCIHNQRPAVQIIPDLRVILERIFDKFMHRFERIDARGKIKTWTGPAAEEVADGTEDDFGGDAANAIA